MRQLPVALTSFRRGSAAICSPAPRPPSTISSNPSGTAPKRLEARESRAWQASAVSGVLSEGFQTTGSPQTNANAAFHDHTATGKLKAVMTPTADNGCQVSISRWPGRSEAMVSPYSWRDNPTAKIGLTLPKWDCINPPSEKQG